MLLAKLFLVVALFAWTGIFSSAKRMGTGEVVGQVTDSWVSSDRVLFTLNIISQKNETGPELGPNTFAYEGQQKLEITKGDVIKLRYNSDDSFGIRVETVEFIDNTPGAVRQTHMGWVITLVAAIAAAGLVLYFWLRRSTASRSTSVRL